MHDDFHQILKKYPLIAARNPQLNLLDEGELLELEVKQSELYRNVWTKQKKKMARFSTDSEIRKFVEPANRFRDSTRAHAIETAQSIEWPSLDSSCSSTESQRAHPGATRPGVMQSPEQDKALIHFFEKISRQLCLALSHPCPVFEDRYSIRVEFLNCIAWVALKVEQAVKIEIRDSSGEWQLSTLRFNLLKPIQTPSWIDQILLEWIGELVRTFHDDSSQAYDWLHQELRKKFHNEAALAGIQQQVTHHMTIDSRMIAAFLHIKQQAGLRPSLMNSEMGEIWPKADFWAELYEKYPALMLLCHLAIKGKNACALRNVNQVRSVCLKHGLSPSGWRYLLRHGETAYQSVISSGIGEARAFSMAIALIEWQSQSGLKGVLPNELALAYVNFAAMALMDSLSTVEHVDPRIARMAARQYARLDNDHDRARFAEKDWLDLLIWMRNTQPGIDKNQWRAGWPCIWRKYREWLGERDTSSEWESRIRNLHLFGMNVKALSSSADLCLEGMKMNHCISTYVKDCQRGIYRVFSIRDTAGDSRIATVGLKFEDGFWSLDQAKAGNNRKVSDDVLSLSKSLAHYYQQSHVQYETGRVTPGDCVSNAPPTRPAGFFHLKVADDNRLMARDPADRWEPAHIDEYPISAELKMKLEAGRLNSTGQEPGMNSAVLTLKLRLELPSEYAVYIWDSRENRDRLLLVD